MIQWLEILAMLFICCPAIGMQMGQCCCGATPVCSAAICSNGGPIGTPTQYQVDISGFVGGCSNCGDLDGSYTMVTGGSCGGSSAPQSVTTSGFYICFGAPTCTTDSQNSVVVGVSFGAAITVTMTHTLTDLGFSSIDLRNNYVWSYSGSPVDCEALSSLSMSFGSASWSVGPPTNCNAGVDPTSGSGAACSGATVTVSTV